MAFTHGKVTTLSIDATDISAYTDSVSFSRDVDNAETTTFGAVGDNKTYIAGLNGASLSCGGKLDAALGAVMDGAQDGSSVLFSYSPDGGTTTYSGSCFLESYSETTPVGGADEWSASFIVTGAVTRA